MKIASGQEEPFREGIRSYIEATNAAPGCLRYSRLGYTITRTRPNQSALVFSFSQDAAQMKVYLV